MCHGNYPFMSLQLWPRKRKWDLSGTWYELGRLENCRLCLFFHGLFFHVHVVKSERELFTGFLCLAEIRANPTNWNSYFRFPRISSSCWCSAIKNGPLFGRPLWGPPVLLWSRPGGNSQGDQSCSSSGRWSLGHIYMQHCFPLHKRLYLGGGDCCEWIGKSCYRGDTGSAGQKYELKSLWLFIQFYAGF